MALGGGLQAALQQLLQQGGQGMSPGENMGFSQPDQDQPSYKYQGVPPPAHPSNPYSQYAALPQIQPTAEETQFETAKAKGADKHTGGFGARLKDALKAFGVNALAGLAQGNGLAALAGGIAGGIGNLVNPQLIHNQMAAQNLAGLQQAATASRQVADQRMNQQMALGKYQQEGARIGMEGRRQDDEALQRQTQAVQRDYENAYQMAEFFRQMGLPVPANVAAKLHQPGLAGKAPIKEPQFITGGDGILRHKETMQPVVAPETGQPITAKEARQQGFTLQTPEGNKRYEYDQKGGGWKIVAQGGPMVSHTSEEYGPDPEYPAKLKDWQDQVAGARQKMGLDESIPDETVAQKLGIGKRPVQGKVKTGSTTTHGGGSAAPSAKTVKALTSAQYNLQVQKHGKEKVDKWMAANGYQVNQ